MIRNVLSVAALCSALPVFAASDPASDGKLANAAFSPALYAATDQAASPSTLPMLVGAGPDGSFESSLDDFTLTEVSEPTTLALFAAGLLGVLGVGYRRRRH